LPTSRSALQRHSWINHEPWYGDRSSIREEVSTKSVNLTVKRGKYSPWIGGGGVLPLKSPLAPSDKELVGFAVLAAGVMKLPSSGIQKTQRITFVPSVENQPSNKPENGGDTFLRNTGSYTDYKALCYKRWELSIKNVTTLSHYPLFGNDTGNLCTRDIRILLS
jgi:hypothetical protein